ncbi:murein L,D-transpeptidase catalytic domain family protein [Legionella hackeliae]|uniref:YkuD domain-containing protein n=1 Tax=Legionella hackeliae TaxID=449 RepID=A0A0A8UNG3_LEGHA|nr:murein L,D-transpeptidase catalytic domain family protein [Legionella hackeliae]KTD14205.1 hypothetical protein Lhac_0517 [Legionella hackeliae]CEK10415.1 conserved exported protein of unknown function [Legionella hackeliae]STX47150.1 Uncharacterised protein [Legionella hackeliae]
MKKKLLLILAVTSTCFSLSTPSLLPLKEPSQQYKSVVDVFHSIVNNQYHYPRMTAVPLSGIREMLHKEAPTLSLAVINKVLTSIKCTDEYNVYHNNILTVIDYSLPSSEKRLWVFDLDKRKLLFHTYVSHGIRSGSLVTNYFSNKHDSKASSIGVYLTENTYYGRDGLSLVLNGLDKGFNDNATSRSVVMHGGWYVDENFIKKYGRAGRSWGCPALPLNLSKDIINTIKDKSLFVIYYPNDNWFGQSKYLNCDRYSATVADQTIGDNFPVENDMRDDILFADMNKNKYREESDPIVVMTADNYERIFRMPPPVSRMLRRQIDNVEYIALSEPEFRNIMILNNQGVEHQNIWDNVTFVVPDVRMQRGYYITQMKIVPLGKIKDVKFDIDSVNHPQQTKIYSVQLEDKVIQLKSTNQFIRWLGL